VEDQPRPGCPVELRERPRRPERQRLAVASHRPAAVAEAVAPHLERAELRDAVLDVIERIVEEVRLEVPARDPLSVESAPVDVVAFESTPQLEPLLVPRVGVAS